MCSGGLVSKPQGEPDSKPAHTVYVVMSCALGPQSESKAQKQLTVYIFSMPWL